MSVTSMRSTTESPHARFSSTRADARPDTEGNRRKGHMETNHEEILTTMELRVRRLWSRSPRDLEDVKSWLKVDLEIFGADLDKRSTIDDMLDPYEIFLRFM